MPVNNFTTGPTDIVITRLKFDFDDINKVRKTNKKPTVYFLAQNNTAVPRWKWVIKSTNNWKAIHCKTHKEAQDILDTAKKENHGQTNVYYTMNEIWPEWGPIDSTDANMYYVVLGSTKRKSYFMTWRNGVLANTRPFAECSQVLGINWTRDVNEATIWRGDLLCFIRWALKAFETLNPQHKFNIQYWKSKSYGKGYSDPHDLFAPLTVTMERVSLSSKRERSSEAADQTLISFEPQKKQQKVDVSDSGEHSSCQEDQTPAVIPIPPLLCYEFLPPPSETCTQYETDYPPDSFGVELSSSLVLFFESFEPLLESQYVPM